MKTDNGPVPDFRESIEIIAQTAYAFRPNAKRILDVGCGKGGMVSELMKLYPNSGFSLLDIHPKPLEFCAKLTQGLISRPPELIQVDIRSVKLPKSHYNIITSMNMFYFFHDVERVTILKKLLKSLARRGCLLVGVRVGEDHPIVAKVIKDRLSKEAKTLFDEKRSNRIVELYEREVQYKTSVSEMHDLLLFAGFTAEVILIYKRNASAVFLAIKP